MLTKRHTPEEIVSKLRQVDVMVAQGQPVAAAVKKIGVTEQSCAPAAFSHADDIIILRFLQPRDERGTGGSGARLMNDGALMNA